MNLKERVKEVFKNKKVPQNLLKTSAIVSLVLTYLPLYSIIKDGYSPQKAAYVVASVLLAWTLYGSSHLPFEKEEPKK